MESTQTQQSDSAEGRNSQDTLILARQEREEQGSLEVEISYGGEGDLHRHHQNCTKHPGHPNFIPIEKFNIKDLPTYCQDEDLVTLVRHLADLTVRVSVKYVSENRLETVPGSNMTYPCYKHRGKNLMRVGTGWVRKVLIIRDCHDKPNTCDCKNCLNSATPHTEFGHIYIFTAAHVVFDKLEGAKTTCHLFFDRGGTPDICNGVVTLTGMSSVWSRFEHDWCMMTYVTHDLDLLEKLRHIVENCYLASERVLTKYPTRDPETVPWFVAPDLRHLLTIIVSHPHGCSKQITIGQCTKIEKETKGSQFTYTTNTCSGSSGALVFVLGYTEINITDLNTWFYHFHNGNCEDNKALNYSCFSLDNLPYMEGFRRRK